MMASVMMKAMLATPILAKQSLKFLGVRRRKPPDSAPHYPHVPDASEAIL
jgi:hypothetical protein